MATQPDSLFRSRGMVGTVNFQMPFIYARERGFNPKTSYWLVTTYGYERVKQVFDFYVSIHKENPAFFWFRKDGSEDREGELKRFCKYIYIAITKNQKLHEKFAGRYYFDQGWGERKG